VVSGTGGTGRGGHGLGVVLVKGKSEQIEAFAGKGYGVCRMAASPFERSAKSL
jgi:hypothetical protein